MIVKKVLLIDDDIDDLELFLEALQELDTSITCHSACDGVDALKIMKQIERPDIIFLDVNMPKMDGWECLSIIKNDPAFIPVPVIMYSTSAHQKEIDKALSLGASNFFRKPDSFLELKDTLKRVIELN